jgi:ABC-type uncharacterized transport system auxiliary subunit
MRTTLVQRSGTPILARDTRCNSLSSLTGLAALAMALFVAGCGSVKPIKYYQISYPSTAPPPSQDAINTTLLVRQFEASHLYLSDQIVYGFDSPQLGTYQTERWAEPPVEMLQDALVRGLRASGRFRAIYTIRSDVSGQYILGGHLYDFKEVDATSIVARLVYEVRLRNRKSGTTVWSHMYNHDEPASEKSVSAIASAMDKNVQRSVQEVQAALEEYFRANPPK